MKLYLNRLPDRRKAISRLSLLLIWFPVCLLSPATFAQEMLTLDQAINIGLENNLSIRMAKNDFRIVQNDNTLGHAGFLPEVYLMGGYEKSITDADVKVVSGTELSQKNAPADWIDAGIYLDWTLFDGTRMFIRKDQLKNAAEAGEMQFRLTVEHNVASIMQAYTAVVSHQMLKKVWEEQVELSELRLVVSENNLKHGSGSALEHQKSQVDLIADKSALAMQQDRLQDASLLLNQLLARDISTQFYALDSINLQPSLILSEIWRDAHRFNAALRLEGFKLLDNDLRLKELKASTSPIISLKSRYHFSQLNTDASFITYNRQLGPSVGLNASFSLFDGWNKQRAIGNARLLHENASLSYQQAQLEMESLILSHFNHYSTQLHQVEQETQHLGLAEKNMSIAQEAFAQGLISSLELREIQQSLLYAKGRLIQALYQAKLSQIALLQLCGKIM